MDMGYNNGLMVQNMKEIGNKIMHMARVNFGMLMVISVSILIEIYIYIFR